MSIGIYLHGLNSSSKSKTALNIADSFNNLIVPDFNEKNVFETIEQIYKIISNINTNQKVFIIGSSLGGFFANYFGSLNELPVILINPLVDPDDMNQFVEIDEFTPESIEQLKLFLPDDTSRGGMLVLLDKDDEIFDYTKAVEKYSNMGMIECFDGGSHRFDHLKQSKNIIGEYIESFF